MGYNATECFADLLVGYGRGRKVFLQFSGETFRLQGIKPAGHRGRAHLSLHAKLLVPGPGHVKALPIIVRPADAVGPEYSRQCYQINISDTALRRPSPTAPPCRNGRRPFTSRFRPSPARRKKVARSVG